MRGEARRRVLESAAGRHLSPSVAASPDPEWTADLRSELMMMMTEDKDPAEKPIQVETDSGTVVIADLTPLSSGEATDAAARLLAIANARTHAGPVL